jgi:hypothetical protein
MIAPAGLAARLATAALTGPAVGTLTTVHISKAIAMTALQKTLITATVAAAVAMGVFQTHQATTLHKQVKLLQQQQAPLAAQIEQLTRNYDDATNRLAGVRDENERLNLDSRELLKLRGELRRLRADSQELARLKGDGSRSNEDQAEKSLLDRVRRLKQRLEQTPEAKIPEFQFLTEQDWLTAANCKLDTDDDYRAAFDDLRGSAEGAFLREADKALRNYLATNNGRFPTELSQLKTYFEKSPPDEILQRYQITPANNIPEATVTGAPADWLITLKSPDSGSLWTLGRNGLGGTSAEDAQEMAVLAPAMKAAFDAAPMINGRKSLSIEQLGPYLTTPEQQAAYQTMMERRNSHTK